MRLVTGGPAERFLATVVLRLHAEALPEDLRMPFAHAVAAELADDEGVATLDYIRLNMSATRP